MLLAKRILRDPNLSQLATRKFKSTINQDDDHKFICTDAVITDILEQKGDENDMFECEMKDMTAEKMLVGTKLKYNKDVPATELGPVNQFKKLNFNQTTPNTIKIRRAGKRIGSLEAR
jgi:hypothetical protein|tara:strand:+ start:266 stop:619 length:354 start_codon:yes stop_codon:yes gene_type:complete